jgi:hypothetical protein
MSMRGSKVGVRQELSEEALWIELARRVVKRGRVRVQQLRTKEAKEELLVRGGKERGCSSKRKNEKRIEIYCPLGGEFGYLVLWKVCRLSSAASASVGNIDMVR